MSSDSDERKSLEWGPRGLETPTSVSGNGPLLAVAICSLVGVIGVPWCTANVGYVDLESGNRGCAVAPSEIQAWALHSGARRPEEEVNLQEWIARHPRRINKQYGAFCDTPLHLTARFGREDLAASLIAAGADVEARNELDERPLHVSARHGHPAVVHLLLARGADVDARGPRGTTPLHAAASGVGDQSNVGARIEVARRLLAAGANVNARERGSGFMPLRYATSGRSRSTAMAELLLSYGADRRGAEAQASAPATRRR